MNSKSSLTNPCVSGFILPRITIYIYVYVYITNISMYTRDENTVATSRVERQVSEGGWKGRRMEGKG